MTGSIGEIRSIAALCAREPVVVADVGARQESGARWMSHFPVAEIMAFDPDPDECRLIEERFAALASPTHRFRALPVALSDVEGRETLHLTAKLECSSLFRPNLGLLRRFADVERFAIQREVSVEVTRLDAIRARQALPEVDLLKLDVQGAELKVLQGARASLAHCLALEIEVEFVPLYEGQALFADVDAFVRAAGFTLFDIRPQRWSRIADAPRDPYAGGRQLMWGDAVYLRDLAAAGSAGEDLREDGRVLKSALIAEHYGQRDYARELLTVALQQRKGSSEWMRDFLAYLSADDARRQVPARNRRSLWSRVRQAAHLILTPE
jgi:FkbM family methyltransferase